MILSGRSCCPPCHDYRTVNDRFTCPDCGREWVFVRGRVPQTWRHGASLHGVWKRVHGVRKRVKR